MFSVEIQDPIVALTLDDGPDPHTTQKILDVLKENGAQATFFLITDHIEGNEQLVAQILEQGNELGNHGVKDEASIGLEEEEFERKFLEADEVLSQFTDVRWFRPGSGVYDQEMLKVVESHGCQTVLGSVHPLDPQIPSAVFSVWYVLQNVQPGSIIILHDRESRGERTAAVLAEVLPELSQRGFHVVTLSELVELGKVSE
jgi:peptidoglycan/xylan/chitin deacetylase (PgdA/CDA1 family)